MSDTNMTMTYEDWLRGCVYHDGRKGNVYLPCDKVLKIADWIEAHRNAVPTTEPKCGAWIPCSERLPERTDKYLVTVENGNVYAGTFSTFDNRFTCKAVAWMELPEPYRGGDDSGKE